MFRDEESSFKKGKRYTVSNLPASSTKAKGENGSKQKVKL